MNTALYHASPTVTRRAIREFGEHMIAVCKDEIARHFTATDLDDVAEIILSKASNKFLDRALDMRLRTMDAKPLVNALAKAERLGYEPGDIVDQDPHTHGYERVVPQPEDYGHERATPKVEDYVAAPAQQFSQGLAFVPTPSHPSAQPSATADRPVWHCPSCYRVFQTPSAHNYVSHPLGRREWSCLFRLTEANMGFQTARVETNLHESPSQHRRLQAFVFTVRPGFQCYRGFAIC